MPEDETVPVSALPPGDSANPPVTCRKVSPEDEAQIAELVRWALQEGQCLDVMGGGSKRDFGQPVWPPCLVSLSRHRGILDYRADELVLTARAGTPLTEIEAALAEKGQELAFEPGDWGPFYGRKDGLSTLGGVVACNMSGPRRLKAGAARDHVLGMRIVTGHGEVVQAGGKVVKNVTGYDLCKLMTGSFGSLGIMSEITVRTLPRAEVTRTLVLRDLDVRGALQTMTQALKSRFDPSGAAWLPADAALDNPVGRIAGIAADGMDRAGYDDEDFSSGSVTLLRLEGSPRSVEAREDGLRSLLSDRTAAIVLDDEESRLLWSHLRDLRMFANPEGVEDWQHVKVWRVSLAPQQAASFVLELKKRLAGRATAKCCLDQGGGQVWISLPPIEEHGEGSIRAVLAETGGGQATLIKAPDALRRHFGVFQPRPPAVEALTRRLREQFDPRGVFNQARLFPDSL